jgi:hypothetical protein
LSEARRVVAILDSFVQTALADDAPLLQNWRLVARVPRTRGRPSDASDLEASPLPAPPGPPVSPVATAPVLGAAAASAVADRSTAAVEESHR